MKNGVVEQLKALFAAGLGAEEIVSALRGPDSDDEYYSVVFKQLFTSPLRDVVGYTWGHAQPLQKVLQTFACYSPERRKNLALTWRSPPWQHFRSHIRAAGRRLEESDPTQPYALWVDVFDDWAHAVSGLALDAAVPPLVWNGKPL
jgi:hypothetical protein